MAANKENIPPPQGYPPTSTPVKTPVKRLPSLPYTPVNSDLSKITSGQVCFICGNSSVKSLRRLAINGDMPETNSLLLMVKRCFSIELTLGQEFYVLRNCIPCRNTLEKSSQLKEQLDSVVAKLSRNRVDESLGCSLLEPTPTQQSCRIKRLVPTDCTPTSSKRESKRSCSLESQRSLSFSSDHSYGASCTPREEARSISQHSMEIYSPSLSERILDESDREEILSSVRKPCAPEHELAKTVYHSSLMQSIEAMQIREMSCTMTRLCSEQIRPGPSVLRTYANPKDLQEKDVLSEAVVELKREQPFLCRLLTVLADPPAGVEQKANTHHIIGTIYGMIMYNRNRNLNALQKMNMAAAIRMRANNELLELLHRCGLCLAASSKIKFQTALGKFNTAGLVRTLRRGQPGKLTLDNIDGMIKARQIRAGLGNSDFHFAASTYYPDRCGPEQLAGLSMAQPPIPDVIDTAIFFLTAEEEVILKKNYGYQIGRLLARLCPELKWMGKCIPDHIPHEYSEIMAQKSEVHPLKIILKDPKYHADCIDIVSELNALLRQCYAAAGRLDEYKDAAVPLGGDQLVRVRVTGARDMRADGRRRDGQRERIFPEIIEFFHIQQDFLDKMVKNLYLKGSSRDECSLPYFKNRLNRKNVNGKVKGKYQSHNDFVHTVGTSLMLRLAMDKMAMEDIGDKPNCPGLPENIGRTHLPRRKNTFEQMMKEIVDEVYKPFTPPEPDRYVPINIHVPGRGLMPVQLDYGMLQRQEAMNVGVQVDGRIHMVRVRLNNDSEDDVKNYTTQLLQWYIHLLEFEDAIKEGDIVRCNICVKMMIPFFYGHSSRSKYLVECIDYILKTEAILPAALAIRCRLGSFINPHGKLGGNKPADMQQENNILVLKDAIKALGAGKSDGAIVRTSLATPVADAITQQYKEILGMHTRSGWHPNKSDNVDVMSALALINRVNPFTTLPGRRMVHYRGIRNNAFARVDKAKFLTLLSKIANRLKRGLNVEENLYDEDD